MVATVILGMLCVHLLCFCVMFMLISRRLHGKKMGMEVFALGNLLLGCAYIMQLLGGQPGWSLISALNHTLTLCAPVTYLLGAMDHELRQKPDENSGVAWFTPEEALKASTEPWMVQRVYSKLTQRAAAYMAR